jgi:hypothetical protein
VVEAIRILTIALLLADVVTLPMALRVHSRPARTTLLVLATDLLIVSAVGRLLSHLHQPVVPYGLPIICPAALALSAYIAQALWAQHQGRYQ